MAQSYKQIEKQIAQLQKRADALRDSEIKGVVDRIKVAIAHYSLTAAHLGLDSVSRVAKPKSKSASKSKGKTAAFADEHGNVWSGRGPRPHWFRDAINAGRSAEEFRVGAANSPKAASARATAPKPAKPKSKRAPSKVNYSDGAGNSWTGRGPRPRWLKAAIESGKSLQDFAK